MSPAIQPGAQRFCAGLALLAGITASAAADGVTVKTNYYKISGSSIHAIRRSMESAKPWRGKHTSDAETKWEVRWSYRLRHTDDGCRVEGFQTRLNVEIMLPQWTDAAGADEELKKRWIRYYKGLSAHEEGHRQLAFAAAALVRKRVGELSTSADCDSLKASVNRVAEQAVAEYYKKEAEYDRRTDHGASQGAVFP